MQRGVACRFLHGPETSEEGRRQIDAALVAKAELKLEIIFYKKNGTPFWCLLDIVPIKNEKREVVLFLASHKDITHTKMAELQQICEFPSSGSNGSADPEAPPANYGRRRSRAVLYQLSGHYNKQDHKMKRTKLKLNNSLLQPRSAAAPLPEYKAAAAGEKSRLVLRHYGTFKAAWDWLMLLATTYVAVAVPYNASFVAADGRASVVSDVLVEALFILDIILNFRTTYVSGKGEVVSDGRSIAVHYLRGWFLVDLLAALPFDLLYASDLYGGEESGSGRVHLLKLTRLLRLARLLQRMDRHSQHSAAILTLLMLSFTLLAHWLACLWYVVADAERSKHKSDWDLGWIHHMADRLKMNISSVTHAESYITALYFTCSSLTSVGFGNVSPNTNSEKIFSICTMLIGALMHAVVFGNVTAIIQRMYSRRSLYQSKWRDLKDFLALHAVPKELRQRMLDYFQATWALYHGIDTHETLREFPEELRGDVSMHLHREILSLPIFEGAPQGCLKLLSLHIRSNFCAPGEYLLHKGDALHSLYYICNGSMEVVQDGMVVAILGKGDLVGCDINAYIASFTGGGGDGKNLGGGVTSGNTGGGQCSEANVVVKSSCDVRALTYCDLKCLSVTGLAEAFRLYPEFLAQFAADITHDLTYNLREGYEAEQEWDTNGGAPSLTLPSISEEEDEDGEDKREPSPTTPPVITKTPPATAKSQKSKSSTPRAAEGVKHFEYGIGRVPARVKDTHSNPNSPRSGVGHHRRARRRSADDDDDRAHSDAGGGGARGQESGQTHQSSLQEDVALLSKEVRSALQALHALTRSSNNCLHCSGHLHVDQRQRTPSPGGSSAMGQPVLSHPTLTLLSPNVTEEAPLRRCSSQPPNMFMAMSGDELHSHRISETTSTIQCTDLTRRTPGSPVSPLNLRTASAISLGGAHLEPQNSWQLSNLSQKENQESVGEPHESAVNTTYKVPGKTAILVVTSDSSSNLKSHEIDKYGAASSGDNKLDEPRGIESTLTSLHHSVSCNVKTESKTGRETGGSSHSLITHDPESIMERSSCLPLHSHLSSRSSSSSSLLSTSTVAQVCASDGMAAKEDISTSLTSYFPSTVSSYTSTTTWTKPSSSPSNVSRLASPPRLSPSLSLSRPIPLSPTSIQGNQDTSSCISPGYHRGKTQAMKTSPSAPLLEQKPSRTCNVGKHRKSLPTTYPLGDYNLAEMKPLLEDSISGNEGAQKYFASNMKATPEGINSFASSSITGGFQLNEAVQGAPILFPQTQPVTCYQHSDLSVPTKSSYHQSQLPHCDVLNEKTLQSTQPTSSLLPSFSHPSISSICNQTPRQRHKKSNSVTYPLLSHRPTSRSSSQYVLRESFPVPLNKTPSLPSLSSYVHPKTVHQQRYTPQNLLKEGYSTLEPSTCSNLSFQTTSYRYSSPSYPSLLANYSSSLTAIPHDTEKYMAESSVQLTGHSMIQSPASLSSPKHSHIPSQPHSQPFTSNLASLAPLEMGVQPASMLPLSSPSIMSTASTQTEDDSWMPSFVLANRERILGILGINTHPKSKGRLSSSVSRSLSDPLRRTKSTASPVSSPEWCSLQWQREFPNPMDPSTTTDQAARKSYLHRRGVNRVDQDVDHSSTATVTGIGKT